MSKCKFVVCDSDSDLDISGYVGPYDMNMAKKDILTATPGQLSRSRSAESRLSYWDKPSESITEDSLDMSRLSVNNVSSGDDMLDNTFQEIEMLLRDGPDYKMPTEKAVVKQNKSPLKSIENLKVPVFKTPLRKTPQPKLRYPQPIGLKNVVSPVAMYIKNTPKYSPMVKVAGQANLFETAKKAQLDETQYFVPSCTSSCPHGTMEIPRVIYRPSALKVTSTVVVVKLPQSIQTLIGNITVIKHEKRMVDTDDDPEEVQRKLDESDFSEDESNEDVSVLTFKQPFNL